MRQSPSIPTLGPCFLLRGCNTARITRQNSLGPSPAARPTVVHVADFGLDAGEIQSSGIMSAPPVRPLSGGILPRPFGLLPQDKETTARNLVALMASSLVKDLKADGFEAQRIAATDALPREGWLPRGVFAQVDEANRPRRAIIGFGAGKTDLQADAASRIAKSVKARLAK